MTYTDPATALVSMFGIFIILLIMLALFKRIIRLEQTYNDIEEVAAINTAKKAGIDLIKYEQEIAIQNTNKFKNALREQMLKEYFKQNQK